MDLNEIPFHPLIKVYETSAFRLFINHSHNTIVVCLDQDFTYKVGTKEEWSVYILYLYIHCTRTTYIHTFYTIEFRLVQTRQDIQVNTKY